MDASSRWNPSRPSWIPDGPPAPPRTFNIPERWSPTGHDSWPTGGLGHLFKAQHLVDFHTCRFRLGLPSGHPIGGCLSAPAPCVEAPQTRRPPRDRHRCSPRWFEVPAHRQHRRPNRACTPPPRNRELEITLNSRQRGKSSDSSRESGGVRDAEGQEAPPFCSRLRQCAGDAEPSD